MSEDKKNAYVVEWQQTVAADDPRGAAHAAYRSLQRPSNATLFTVTKVVETEEEFEPPEDVDLHEEFEMSFHNLHEPCQSDEEAEKLSYEGRIQVNVGVDLASCISRDHETFLDLLEERILGYRTDCRFTLEDYHYRVVGTNADRNIVIAVSANLVAVEGAPVGQEESKSTTKEEDRTADASKEAREREAESDAQSREDAEGAGSA